MIYFYTITDDNQKYMANNLIESLKKHSVSLNILTIYNHKIGNLSKIIEFEKFLSTQKYKDDDIIVLLDAFDVLCSKTPAFILLYLKNNNIDILFSGENTCGNIFQDTRLYFSDKKKGDSYYINSGVVIAKANKYKEFLRLLILDSSRIQDRFKGELSKYLQKSDQALIRYFVYEHDLLNCESNIRVAVDTTNEITFTDTSVERSYDVNNHIFIHTWGIHSLLNDYRYGQLRKYHKNLEKLNIIPYFKTKIVIMLLETSYYRMENISREISKVSEKYPGIHWTIMNSIDGNTIKRTYIDGNTYLLEINDDIYYYNSSKREWKPDMTLNEIGCALSHYKIYEKLCKDDKYSNYMILEDDFKITDIDMFIQTLYCMEKYDNYDIALLHDSSKFFPLIKHDNINEVFVNIEKRYFNCTIGYTITKRGAKKLINRFNKIIKYPSDDLLACNYLENNLDIVATSKPLIRYDKTLFSTII